MSLQRSFKFDKGAIPFKGNAILIASRLDEDDIPKGGFSLGVMNVDFKLNMNVKETSIADTSGDVRGTWRTFQDEITPTLNGTMKAVPKEFWPAALKGTLQNVAPATVTEYVRVYPVLGDNDEIYRLSQGLNALTATFTNQSGSVPYVQPDDVKLNKTHPSFVVVKGGAIDQAALIAKAAHEANPAEPGYVIVKVVYEHSGCHLVTPVDTFGVQYQLDVQGLNMRNNSSSWTLTCFKTDWNVMKTWAITSQAEADIPVDFSLLSNAHRLSQGLNPYFDYQF